METTTGASSQPRLGLLSLPSEVRVRLLRYLLVKPDDIVAKDIQVRPHRCFSAALTAQILSTCTTLRNEGIPLLWCENRFFIARKSDLQILKRYLPNRRKDTHLIRHLHFEDRELFSPIRVREMRNLQMLQTIKINIPPYKCSANEALSLIAMTEDLQKRYLRNLTWDEEFHGGLQAVLKERPDVDLRLQRLVTSDAATMNMCGILIQPMALAEFSVELNNGRYGGKYSVTLVRLVHASELWTNFRVVN